MGDGDTVVIDRINAETIDLGNKPYRYSLDESLDMFFPDYYPKCFLINSLDVTSWDSVRDNVNTFCYKGYPEVGQAKRINVLVL